jgi:hypothetical protein
MEWLGIEQDLTWIAHSDITCLLPNLGVTLISRLRLDAQLFEFPENVPVGKRGRKSIKGKRINLKELIADLTQPWQALTVGWYGGEQKIIECSWCNRATKKAKTFPIETNL